MPMMYVGNPPFVTFIIPSLARPTLFKTLESLKAQSGDPWDWRAIIIFDNVEPISFPDFRLTLVKVEGGKLGGGENHGGQVRNEGLKSRWLDPKMGMIGEWVAFVDDDDWLDHSYIFWLKNEARDHPEADVIVFHMTYPSGYVVPPHGMDWLEQNFIGISFAVKTEFLNKHDVKFENSGCEDYLFLKACEEAGAKIFFSHYAVYNVGQNDPNRGM